jgi:hypothetical protein
MTCLTRLIHRSHLGPAEFAGIAEGVGIINDHLRIGESVHLLDIASHSHGALAAGRRSPKDVRG